jgi:hypothetical protein
VSRSGHRGSRPPLPWVAIAAGIRADPSPAAARGTAAGIEAPGRGALGADVRIRPPSPIVTSCGRGTGRQPCRPLGSSPGGTVSRSGHRGSRPLSPWVPMSEAGHVAAPIVTSCGRGTGRRPCRPLGSSPGGTVSRSGHRGSRPPSPWVPMSEARPRRRAGRHQLRT